MTNITVRATVNLADTVTCLGRTIEESMASLYDLQTATINAEKYESTSLSDVFQAVRQTLRAEWETLIKFMKDCHAFGEDIAVLKTGVSGGSSEIWIPFLQDMGESSAGLVRTAQNLRKTIDTPIHLFDEKKEEFFDLFIKASHYDNSVHRNKWTASSVDAARQASLYPDGKAMWVATQNHFFDMQALYDNAVTFLKIQHNEFHTASESTAGITVRRMSEVSDDWIAGKKALSATIATISRACDAVGIDAKGAPSHSANESSVVWNFVQWHWLGTIMAMLFTVRFPCV